MKTPQILERDNVNRPSVSFNSCQKRPLKGDLKHIFHLTTLVVGRDKETDRESEEGQRYRKRRRIRKSVRLSKSDNTHARASASV